MIQLDKQYEPSEVEKRWGQFWQEKNFFHADETRDLPAYSIVIPPDIVQMVTQVMTGESVPETPELPNSIEEKDDEPSLEELLKSVEMLSTDSMEMVDDQIEDIPPSDEPVESLEEEALPPLEESSGEEIIEEPFAAIADDILGEMTQEVETHLEEQAPEPELPSEEPVLEDEESFDEDFEVYAEVRPQKMESFDDLDSAFKEIVSYDVKQPVETKEGTISVLGGIVPEPEDLLEKMAPGAFSGTEKRPHSPEEIREHLNANVSSESTHYQTSPNFENSDDRFIQVAGEQVRQILERSLDSSLRKEMSGLSDILVKTIREVVREITPEIARSIIREEIEKIKKI